MKLRFVKCHVWSIALYGMEGWIKKLNAINKLEAFGMWNPKDTMDSKITYTEVLMPVDKERLKVAEMSEVDALA